MPLGYTLFSGLIILGLIYGGISLLFTILPGGRKALRLGKELKNELGFRRVFNFWFLFDTPHLSYKGIYKHNDIRIDLYNGPMASEEQSVIDIFKMDLGTSLRTISVVLSLHDPHRPYKGIFNQPPGKTISGVDLQLRDIEAAMDALLAEQPG